MFPLPLGDTVVRVMATLRKFVKESKGGENAVVRMSMESVRMWKGWVATVRAGYSSIWGAAL